MEQVVQKGKGDREKLGIENKGNNKAFSVKALIHQSNNPPLGTSGTQMNVCLLFFCHVKDHLHLWTPSKAFYSFSSMLNWSHFMISPTQ